jgi:hypothetical protein
MKTPNLNGWEKLICPYFAPTCQRVLGQYLEDNGFTETGLNEIGGVMFSRFGIFLEVSYELETVPQDLTMCLGIGEKKYDKGGHICCVPYWYLLPRDSPENTATGAGFKNEAELEKLLLRFKDVVLETYARPLWLNLDRLEKAITNFRAEFSC